MVELLDGKGNKSESVKRRKYKIKKEKDQDLRPCFLLSLPRQGRSLWLPTLPFQKTNRYAVVGSIQMLFLLQTRINHANRCAEFGSMQMLFLLQTRINHANCYSVVAINADAVFTPNSYQSCQSLRGRWFNKCCLRLLLA